MRRSRTFNQIARDIHKERKGTCSPRQSTRAIEGSIGEVGETGDLRQQQLHHITLYTHNEGRGNRGGEGEGPGKAPGWWRTLFLSRVGGCRRRKRCCWPSCWEAAVLGTVMWSMPQRNLGNPFFKNHCQN